MSMEKVKDILLIEADNGERVYVSSPYGEAFEGDMVKTTSGLFGTVIKKMVDYHGELSYFIGQTTVIRVAAAIYGFRWAKGGDEDAD